MIILKAVKIRYKSFKISYKCFRKMALYAIDGYHRWILKSALKHIAISLWTVLRLKRGRRLAYPCKWMKSWGNGYIVVLQRQFPFFNSHLVLQNILMRKHVARFSTNFSGQAGWLMSLWKMLAQGNSYLLLKISQQFLQLFNIIRENILTSHQRMRASALNGGRWKFNGVEPITLLRLTVWSLT